MFHTHSFIYHQSCILFFSQYFSFSCQYHSPMLRIRSFIYHERCIIFFAQYLSLHCQYHSTNAPYSFLHLLPTLYTIFLPVP
jgi:hypothetical protein